KIEHLLAASRHRLKALESCVRDQGWVIEQRKGKLAGSTFDVVGYYGRIIDLTGVWVLDRVARPLESLTVRGSPASILLSLETSRCSDQRRVLVGGTSCTPRRRKY